MIGDWEGEKKEQIDSQSMGVKFLGGGGGGR